MYYMQYPSLQVSGYFKPANVRSTDLEKANYISVDLSPLKREKDLHVAGGINNPPCIAAIWNSAIINSHNTVNYSAQPAEDFLHRNESYFNDVCWSMAGRDGVDLNSLLNLVEVLNEQARVHQWQYSLLRVGNWDDLLRILMAGYTVMIGGSIYKSFDEAKITGIVPMPKLEEGLLGGHIVNLVAFDRKADTGVALGNLGSAVGNRGKFTYRGSYLRNLGISRDFFVLVPRVR